MTRVGEVPVPDPRPPEPPPVPQPDPAPMPDPVPPQRAGHARRAMRRFARAGVGAALPAVAPVAGLDRLGFFAGRVVEVRLHRRGGAAEAAGDLGDRELLGVRVLARERGCTAVLDDAFKLGDAVRGDDEAPHHRETGVDSIGSPVSRAAAGRHAGWEWMTGRPAVSPAAASRRLSRHGSPARGAR